MSTNTNGIYFYYSPSDVLAGVSTHGARTYLGYHMNGLYNNSSNGGYIPVPASSYLTPTKHFTQDGKFYLDQAIKSAATGIQISATGDTECLGSTISLTSTGVGVISYSWAGPSGFTSN
jgi:hypothetical protein